MPAWAFVLGLALTAAAFTVLARLLGLLVPPEDHGSVSEKAVASAVARGRRERYEHERPVSAPDALRRMREREERRRFLRVVGGRG